jgi:outer membrane protein OmpA-like peptidoglycan-associated protein
MTRYQTLRPASFRVLLPIALAAFSAIASAQTVKTEGLIKSRSGATMTLETSGSQTQVVVLTDSTQVGQVQGLLKARKKDMSMAALIPGLQVKVEGTYDVNNALVAKSVSFTGDDLERAESIQAGMHETKVLAQQTEVQAQQNKEELAKQNAMLAAQKAKLQQQQANLAQQQQELTAQQQKVAANKAAIDAAVARFGQLDDYYILDEVTVYFGNGKVALDPQYQPQLMALATKAKTVDAYMLQVIGYASTSGSVTLNQKLSEDRASNVTNFLVQQGHIPLTNMLAPGAMGESRQVGSDKTAEGQAENRRVVARVLQNKGIAGAQANQ